MESSAQVQRQIAHVRPAVQQLLRLDRGLCRLPKNFQCVEVRQEEGCEGNDLGSLCGAGPVWLEHK